MKRFVHVVILGMIFSTLNVYSQLAVGGWRTHLAYSSVTQVAESPNFIFGYADGSLFSYGKSDGDLRTYSKVTGLNDNGIANIEYSKENNLLFIAYQNANIDLLFNDGVINIPDFMNSVRPGDKTIYNVCMKGNFAYLSTGIGVIVVDVVKREIPATYTMKKDGVILPVYGVALTDTEIFASTSAGVYKADKNSNLLDPLNWKVSGTTVGTQVVEYKGVIYLLKKGTGILKYDNLNWTSFLNNGSVNNLRVSNDRMLIVTPTVLYSYDNSLNQTSITGLTTVSDASYSTDNTYWTASGSNGLSQVKNTGEKLLTDIKPDGPASSIYAISYSDRKLYAVNGMQRNGGPATPVMIFDAVNNKWTNIQTYGIPPYGLTNANGILTHPNDPTRYFVSTCLDGVFEFKNNEFSIRYTRDNSLIEGIYANNERYQWITGLCFDKEGNLWMFNDQVVNSIKVLKKDGTWASLYFNDLSKFEAERIFNTSWNQKWVLANNWEKCVFVFDDEGEFKNKKYKQYKTFYDQDGQKIESSAYFSMAEDKNGSLWIGTDRGPIVFNNVKNNPDIVFNSNFTCTRIKIPRNDGTNYADYLLESEQINAIAVDGGNRKWLGTSNSGLYLVSADGLQTINHFTRENSPLLSNNILSLAIDPISGEVFIVTDKGLISYKGDAIEGKVDYSNVYAYPNPVKPDYSGVITITGLISDSNVKITDVAGNLVYEGQSQGGQLSWTGTNKNGEKMSTGVYLVWATNNDGSQNVVCKIMIVR